MAITYRETPPVKAIAKFFKYNDANVDVAQKLGDIPAGAIIVAVRITTHWPWTGTSQIVAGWTSSGTQFTNGTLITSAGVVHPTLHANSSQPYTAAREVWARVANGATSTQGWSVFVVEYVET